MNQIVEALQAIAKELRTANLIAFYGHGAGLIEASELEQTREAIRASLEGG